jgi:hypothetical protein
MVQSRALHAVAAATAVSAHATQLNEKRALHRLFLNRSSRYTEHCRRTGASESAGLCAAASRYRQERTLASLVTFMDYLDELDIPVVAGGRK